MHRLCARGGRKELRSDHYLYRYRLMAESEAIPVGLVSGVVLARSACNKCPIARLSLFHVIKDTLRAFTL